MKPDTYKKRYTVIPLTHIPLISNADYTGHSTEPSLTKPSIIIYNTALSSEEKCIRRRNRSNAYQRTENGKAARKRAMDKYRKQIKNKPVVTEQVEVPNIAEGKLKADHAEVLAAIKQVFKEGDVVEVRVPKAKGSGTISGYFDDHNKLAQGIVELSGKHSGVYYTLNPTVPALLARTNNMITTNAINTTSDNDIQKRSWLLIDADPVRPAGISSNDEEKALAFITLKQVNAYLRSKGWPQPISADSGNGYHLLYRIDIENSKESSDLIKSVLKSLADKFDTKDVKIDRAVFNAARIVKAYGSKSCKGAPTDSRPHRMSRIRAQAGDGTVTIEQLQEVAGEVTTGLVISPKTYMGQGQGKVITEDRMQEFIEYYELDTKPVEKVSNGLKWVLTQCPFNPEHSNGEVAIFLNEDGGPGFKCMHNSCTENTWKPFRAHLEKESGKVFVFFHNSPAPSSAYAKPTNKFDTAKALNVKGEKIDWLWPDVIPMGKLTLLAGQPGVGKGCATVDIIARASTGAAWPKNVKNTLPPMESLLISSEDSASDTLVPRLIAAEADLSKVNIHNHTITAEGEKGFSLDTDLPTLREYLENNPDIKLVIIDPISNHLGSLSLNREQEVRKVLTPLGKLAEKCGVAIIIVSHLNKNPMLDPSQRVLGAGAMVGAVRASWLFSRQEDGPRQMTPIKGNVIKDDSGLTYEIEEEEITLSNGDVTGIARIVWGDTTYNTAGEALSKDASTSKFNQAKVCIKQMLQDGPADKSAIETQMLTFDIPDKVMNRALKQLGCVLVGSMYHMGAQ
jgi:AAA domain